MTEPTNWREEYIRLQAELDSVAKECSEWKEKWERLMLFHQQPRLPVRGLTTIKPRLGDDLK